MLTGTVTSGDLRADNLMLLRTRVEMASRLDEMRDRLDALTARVREQEPRRERMRYRSPEVRVPLPLP